MREAHISRQNDVQMHQGVNCGSVGNTNNSNLAPVYSIAIASSEIAYEFVTDSNEAKKLLGEGTISQFDCDLKREVDRVTRQRNCTDFNVQMLSRFHGDLTAQTGMTVPPNKSFNNVASCFPLSQPVSAGCAIDKTKSSPMSIKERLMNESGKIFKIPKREIRPSANKAKLNDWLAHNKKQPIKRKLNNDDDCETHINSKRIKITETDVRESCIELQHRLPIPLNNKHAHKKSLIPRLIQSDKANNTQTSSVSCKDKHINKAMLSQSECIKPVPASLSEAIVHKSFIPRLVKVNRHPAVNGINHITSTSNKLTKANNFKPVSVSCKPEAVNTERNAHTSSIKHTFYKDVKPMHMHLTPSMIPTSIISKQTSLSNQIHTSFTVSRQTGANSTKPTLRKSSKHTLSKSIIDWNKYF